jgi:ribose transport system substrate-binding protein
MKRALIVLLAVLLVAGFAFAGGKQEEKPAKEQKMEKAEEAPKVMHKLAPGAVIAGTVVANEMLEDGTKGVDKDVLTLSAADEEKLKSGSYTAAIVMHVLDASWPQQQIAGMKSVFDKYGIDVISVTGAGGKPEVQIENIENVIAMKPDVILSIPVDPSAEGPAYKAIGENGIELILLDMIPAGLQHPADYSCLVSSSSYGNGVSAADIMAYEFIEMGLDEAEVAVMKLNFSHFVTEERVRGFKERVAQHYPWIKIAAEADFPFDMPKVTEISSGMLAANPGLDGAFVIWMTPAMSLVAAAREAGKDPAEFIITTVDLEEDGAMEIAADSYIKGTGAQDPYQNGVAEAIAACRAILGYDNPSYVAVPGYAVNRDNIVEGYKAILGEDPPKQIKDAANK